MYFPYLRGRQFELIALRELVEMNLIGNDIIPIIEPVKMSSTLVKTLERYIVKGYDISFIFNPKVGSFYAETKKKSNIKHLDKLKKLIKEKEVIPAHYMCDNSVDTIENWIKKGREIEKSMVICDDEDLLSTYNELFNNDVPKYTLIKDKSEFRENISKNRILIADNFKKQKRNTDYINKPDEFFSSSHLSFKSNGYVGFSDYSVIGDDYSDSGFAPYAVAIHIVYFDKDMKLRVYHFVSDTNDGIDDPATKFAEALGKLVEWNKEAKLNTYAIKEFTKMYENEIYPGLGVAKKLSIMHHIELMSNYLESVKSL